jgi:hypothetical protein
MSYTTPKQLEEQSIRDIMQQLSLSESEAREWRAAFMRRYLANRENVYTFLKANNPRVVELENSGIFSDRIGQVSAEMQIPEATATALVISSEVIAPKAMELLRKHRRLRRKKSPPEDIQEMLGVTVPVPQDVWDALELEDA